MMNILVLTNKRDITSDFIVQNLSDLGVPFYRLNTDEIGNTIRLSFDVINNEYLIYDSARDIIVNLLQIKSVYFRRPEILVHSKDLTTGEKNFIRSELSFTLEAIYKILGNAFWVNTVDAIRNAENKIFQLMLAKEIGFIIPNTILSSQPNTALSFFSKNDGLCIIKPVKSGLVAGETEEGVIFTSQVHLDRDNVDRILTCPVYLQNLVPKYADLRVTLIGDKLFCAMIHSQHEEDSKIDWRKAGHPLQHSAHELPKEIIAKCFELAKKLNLNFAAIDFILDQKNNYIFLEINPNGQWAWIERQLNFNISNEITNLLIKNAA
jgi:glutathione synthase/RimK-type ligase-like ATP-grasp enzyme